MELCSYKTWLIVFLLTVQLIWDGQVTLRNTLFLQLIHKPFKLKIRKKKEKANILFATQDNLLSISITNAYARIFDAEDSTKIKIIKISNYT